MGCLASLLLMRKRLAQKESSYFVFSDMLTLNAIKLDIFGFAIHLIVLEKRISIIYCAARPVVKTPKGLTDYGY